MVVGFAVVVVVASGFAVVILVAGFGFAVDVVVVPGLLSASVLSVLVVVCAVAEPVSSLLSSEEFSSLLSAEEFSSLLSAEEFSSLLSASDVVSSVLSSVEVGSDVPVVDSARDEFADDVVVSLLHAQEDITIPAQSSAHAILRSLSDFAIFLPHDLNLLS